MAIYILIFLISWVIVSFKYQDWGDSFYNFYDKIFLPKIIKRNYIGVEELIADLKTKNPYKKNILFCL